MSEKSPLLLIINNKLVMSTDGSIICMKDPVVFVNSLFGCFLENDYINRFMMCFFVDETKYYKIIINNDYEELISHALLCLKLDTPHRLVDIDRCPRNIRNLCGA